MQLQDQQEAPISRHGAEAEGHSVTSLAGNTIITSHIHFKAGTNTQVHTAVWTLDSDVRGADAVVVQAEGEAAAGVRLRLRAVPPTPAGHISRRREDPQSAG